MAPRTKASKKAPARLILDSGAVIALARGSDRVRAFLARALQAGAQVFIPSVVVAETVRGNGPNDAPVNRGVSVGTIVPLDEATARNAGALLAAARSSATIDAIIVATTQDLGGGRILTGDVRDMRPLARRAREVTIHQV